MQVWLDFCTATSNPSGHLVPVIWLYATCKKEWQADLPRMAWCITHISTHMQSLLFTFFTGNDAGPRSCQRESLNFKLVRHPLCRQHQRNDTLIAFCTNTELKHLTRIVAAHVIVTWVAKRKVWQHEMLFNTSELVVCVPWIGAIGKLNGFFGAHRKEFQGPCMQQDVQVARHCDLKHKPVLPMLHFHWKLLDECSNISTTVRASWPCANKAMQTRKRHVSLFLSLFNENNLDDPISRPLSKQSRQSGHTKQTKTLKVTRMVEYSPMYSVNRGFCYILSE